MQHARREGSHLHHLISGAGAALQDSPSVPPEGSTTSESLAALSLHEDVCSGWPGHPGSMGPAGGTERVPGFCAKGPGFMAVQLDKRQLRVHFYGVGANGSAVLLYNTAIPRPADTEATVQGRSAWTNPGAPSTQEGSAAGMAAKAIEGAPHPLSNKATIPRGPLPWLSHIAQSWRESLTLQFLRSRSLRYPVSL